MKDILEAVKESLAIIAVIFACAVSLFCVMRLGEWVTLLIAGCALYLNRLWFAGVLGAGTLVTVASIFINKGKPDIKRK